MMEQLLKLICPSLMKSEYKVLVVASISLTATIASSKHDGFRCDSNA